MKTMTVEEVIEKLYDFPPDTPVCVTVEGHTYPIQDTAFVEGDDTVQFDFLELDCGYLAYTGMDEEDE